MFQEQKCATEISKDELAAGDNDVKINLMFFKQFPYNTYVQAKERYGLEKRSATCPFCEGGTVEVQMPNDLDDFADKLKAEGMKQQKTKSLITQYFHLQG